jgi:hypothetical protein
MKDLPTRNEIIRCNSFGPLHLESLEEHRKLEVDRRYLELDHARQH